MGFAVPPSLPKARCALTAPFHPYRGQNATQPRRSVLCGTVPEASPRRVRPRRMLSGTVRPWSPDFPPRPPFGIGAERPSGRLTRIAMRAEGGRVKASSIFMVCKKKPTLSGRKRQARSTWPGEGVRSGGETARAPGKGPRAWPRRVPFAPGRYAVECSRIGFRVERTD